MEDGNIDRGYSIKSKIFNSFDRLEEIFNDINNNEKVRKIPIFPIFIVRVINIQPFPR